MRRHRHLLDEPTADSLLVGRIAPADAPPGFAAVAGLVREARDGFGSPEPDPQLLAAMVHALDEQPTTADRKATMPSKARTAKIGTIAAALVLSTAGAAAAATGNLPDAAQDALSNAAEHVGFDLPASHDDHPTGNADNPTDADDHGVDVSDTARNSDTTGREHGQAVSEVARAGHGADADDEGTDDTDDATEPGAPEDPGAQGAATASDASDGRSDEGRAHADDHPTPEDHPTAEDNPGTSHRP